MIIQLKERGRKRNGVIRELCCDLKLSVWLSRSVDYAGFDMLNERMMPVGSTKYCMMIEVD